VPIADRSSRFRRAYRKNRQVIMGRFRLHMHDRIVMPFRENAIMETSVEHMRNSRSAWRWIGLLAVATWTMGLHVSAHAQVASFDCAKAATPTEHAICSTPSLGAKDVRMATYYEVLQHASPAVSGMAYREFRDNIHDEQTNWLKRQRDVCKRDASCLEQTYDQRIKALRDTLMKNVAVTYGRMCDGG
jgi:hypothetical protein